MAQPNQSRRRILAGLAGTFVITRPAIAAIETPRAAEGPFYPTRSMRPADIDNDLVKIAGAVREAGGEIISLRGRITDPEGKPLSGYRIEIWQCDANGKYMHPGDRQSGQHDSGFQGFGHDITDSEGRYSFRTIKPAKYPGRTPHIHAKVFDAAGNEVLTTQFYEAGNPDNSRDGLYARMSKEQADSVSMSYTTGANGVETRIDVVV